VLATAGTAALMRHRLRRRADYHALEFRQPYPLRDLLDTRAQNGRASRTADPRGASLPVAGRADATLTLYPAGHVLGSAQALVETPPDGHRGGRTHSPGRRLLYSGDFKLQPGLAAEPIEVPQADVVVMETTFGRPGYVFPPAEEVVAAIRDFCRAAHDVGAVPLLLAYAVGKGPELLARLAVEEWDFVLHPTLFGVVKEYEELGISFPPYRLLKGGTVSGDRPVAADPGVRVGTPPVVLCPPGPDYREARICLPRARVAHISGWAMDRGAAYRMGVDACFPLSDHAGYPELLEYVRLTGARQVLTLHGFDAEFAQDLRLMGYDARPLTAPAQPSLF
jgi:Cft2 family RNA processing exonuclease